MNFMYASVSMATNSGSDTASRREPVSKAELNAWRRGFTPQAEIWNGRLAMLGLSVALILMLVMRLIQKP